MTTKWAASGIEGRDARSDVHLQGGQDPTKERKNDAQESLNGSQQTRSNKSNLYAKAEYNAGKDTNCSCENHVQSETSICSGGKRRNTYLAGRNPRLKSRDSLEVARG